MTDIGAEPGHFELAGPPASFITMPATDIALPSAVGGPPRDAPPLSPAGREQAAAPLRDDAPIADDNDDLRPLPLAALLALPIKPRGMVLDPIIPEKGLAMVYAHRGTGKTHVALGVGYAVATGARFLRWRAERPRRVLLIDGEMPAQDLQQRLAWMVAADPRPGADGGALALLDIMAADLLERDIGNLAEPQVQAKVERWLDGVELVILDNLTSLTGALRENDGDAWSPLQRWLLRLRRRGISVLIIHHAGKGGEQRGTSRREDVLDTSISLRAPDDYAAADGARFAVHIEKGRGIHGDAARPFEASLEVIDGRAQWSMKEIEDTERLEVARLLAAGMSIREIAEETGLHRSKVHRLKQRIADEAAELPV